METVHSVSPLNIYNSLTRRVDPVRETPEGPLGMYTCGPTVYSEPHIGNMRAYVSADMLRRAMAWKSFPVRQVVNFTDVGHLVADSDDGDDKVEISAREESVSVGQLTDRYIDSFLRSCDALAILPAHHYPRATEYVPKMLDFLQVLQRRGVTYEIESGLYFDTSLSPSYGAMAQVDIAGSLEGARIGTLEGRRNKTDFCLWRRERPGERRLQRWDSPWGWGAPGWHLECSVMAIELLGDHFALHTGGVDHRDLHHVNEIAQSEAFLGDGQDWVRHWFHNEFLVLNGRKLAKSAGDRITVGSVTGEGYWPSALRYLFATASYRKQLAFNSESLDKAQRAVERLHERFGLVDVPEPVTLTGALDTVRSPEGRRALEQVDLRISNDLATPAVLATLHSLPFRGPEQETVARLILGLLGIRPQPAARALEGIDAEYVETMVARRDEARRERRWAAADQIRDELAGIGVHMTDTPEGTKWTVTPESSVRG